MTSFPQSMKNSVASMTSPQMGTAAQRSVSEMPEPPSQPSADSFKLDLTSQSEAPTYEGIPERDATSTLSKIDEAYRKSLAENVKGRASEVNDIQLTMRGIVDGDPVGMETFDLGFYEDGTPAIFINGAPVPIENSQWMALLNMRKNQRDQMQAMMEFRKASEDAQRTVSAVVSSMPNMPKGLAEGLMYLARNNPDVAGQQLARLGNSFATDGGKTQALDISVGIMQSQVENRMRTLYEQGPEEPVTIQETGVGGVVIGSKQVMQRRPSRVDMTQGMLQQKLQMQGANREEIQGQMGSLPLLQGLFPIAERKYLNGGASMGVFDWISSPYQVGGTGNNVNAYGAWDTLKRVATIPELWDGHVVPQPQQPLNVNDPMSVNAWMQYLTNLDEWASIRLGWDRSSPQMIQQHLQALAASASQSAGMSMASPAPISAPQQQMSPVDQALENAGLGGFDIQK
jgi:hypothetical protein